MPYKILLISAVLVAAVFFSKAEAKTGTAYYDYGVFAFEEGNYQEAEKNLRIAIGFEPDNPYYHHYLGKTYLKTAEYEKAFTHLSRAEELEPNIIGLKSDMALVRYRMGNFLAAMICFKELSEKYPEDASAWYYAGMSLYKLGQCEQAEEYLRKASEISPGIQSHSDFIMGKCYQQRQTPEQAIEKFRQVVNDATADSIKDTAREWIDAIEMQQHAMKPWQLHIMTGRFYDDNVRLEPEDQEIFADKSDWATRAYVSGNYDFIHQPHFSLGAGLDYHQTWYDDVTEFDQNGTIFNVHTKYSTSLLTFGLHYRVSYHWVDTDSALRRSQISPDILWKATNNLICRLSYAYYDNEDFLDDGRDGDTNKASVNVYYRLPDKRSRLYASLSYEKNDASHPNECFSRVRTTLGGSFKLPWKATLELTGKYDAKNYDNTDTYYHITRNDDKHAGIIALSRNVCYDWLSIIAEYRHTRNNSDISAKEYTQNCTSILLRASF